uniref:Endoplasmic reticulum lectin 1 n=1 Tax=Aceria tosichella TaxID=561515 RepID=A0A6G1SQ53_9ACAR
MILLESFHHSFATGNLNDNTTTQVYNAQYPIKRKPMLYSHHYNKHQSNKHLLSIILGVIFCANTIYCLLIDDSYDYKGYDNKNHLGGDLDLYKITWQGSIESSSNLLDSINQNQDDPKASRLFQIATKDDEHYVCLDPPLNNKNELNFDTSARNSSSEKSKSPIQLLEPLLRGNSCSYKFDLFWIYELCHGKFLRQYHEENAKYKAKVTQEYYLGKMDHDQIKLHEEEYDREVAQAERMGQSRPTILVNGVYKPYVVVNMTGGTKCDLTKRNRVARIVYVCNEEPSLELYSIKEISTCEYEAIVLSPHLCQHKDFKIDTATQHEIKCYSLNNSPKQPKRIKDFHNEDEEERPRGEKFGQKRRGVAYLQGRTLIIDADLLLS